MKKIYKYTSIIISILLFVVIVILSYLKLMLPDIDLKDVNVQITNERVERGKYLANHVMVCIDCHSARDWSKFSGPPIPGTEGQGGDKFDHSMGFPGKYYSANITPFNLSDWSDAEIFRAITSGVKKNNDAIFPVMPYMNYGKLDKEDIYSVIAYIRSLKPIEHKTMERTNDFPINFLINTFPKEAHLSKKPNPADKVKYGEYLVTAAACADCHTPFESGQPVKDMLFAGGREFKMPFGILTTPNLTPDNETGLGKWTERMFISRFKRYDTENGYEHIKTDMNKYNTIMPWVMYSGMTENDLSAIYQYLHSLKPIKHNVITMKMGI